MVSVEPWPVVPPQCGLGPLHRGATQGRAPVYRQAPWALAGGEAGCRSPRARAQVARGLPARCSHLQARTWPGQASGRSRVPWLQNPRAPTHLAAPTSGSRSGPGLHGTSDPRRFALRPLRPLRPGRAGHCLNPRMRAPHLPGHLLPHTWAFTHVAPPPWLGHCPPRRAPLDWHLRGGPWPARPSLAQPAASRCSSLAPRGSAARGWAGLDTPHGD